MSGVPVVAVARGGRTFLAQNRAQFERIWQDVWDGREYDMGDLGPAPVVIDGGAHVGVASTYFAERYPGALVLAFEPNPESYALLRSNLERNGVRRVLPFNAAIAPTAGAIPLYTVPGDTWGDATIRQSWHDDRPTRTVLVPAVTLSSLLTGPVDLLKLDIEGAEAAVLAEAGSRLRRVRRLAIEFHGTRANPGNSLDGVLATLRRAGFRVRIEQDGRPVSRRRIRRDDPFWLVVRGWRPERGIGRGGAR